MTIKFAALWAMTIGAWIAVCGVKLFMDEWRMVSEVSYLTLMIGLAYFAIRIGWSEPD